MKDNLFDYCILGGGCAGLSLAMELAKNPNKSLLILDQREAYTADKTWCFWNLNSHPFDSCVKHQWNSWSVRLDDITHTCTSEINAYQCIPSDVFYTYSLNRLKQKTNVKFLLNTHVHNLVENDFYVTIDSSQGTFQSKKVFNSIDKRKASFFQHFLGWHVKTTKDVFELEKMTLMDFDVNQTHGIHFMYVLPFQLNEALIESTYISGQPLPDEIYEEDIYSYLKNRFGETHYTIIRKEKGCLPLDLGKKVPNSPRISAIGLASDAMKPSTGYAFLNIQKGIKNYQNSTPYKSSLKYQFLDKVFINYLKTAPQNAPKLFFSLFQNNSAETLIRFLNEQASFIEILKIIYKMPKFAMFKIAFKTLLGKKK